MEKLIINIIILLAVAEFAIQIQISTLATRIKKYMLMNVGIQSKLKVLSNLQFWFSLFKTYSFILYPFILLLVLFFNILYLFNEMVNCPYCIGFHLAWAVNYFYLGDSLPESFILAPIALIWVKLLDIIHSN